MLKEQEISVEQMAAAVGYSSRSNFAVAFGKSVEVNPKTYQLQRRK